MMRLFGLCAFIMFIIVAGCKNPDCTPVRVPYDTCIVDTFIVNLNCCPDLDSIKQVIDSIYSIRHSRLDSLYNARRSKLDSLKQAALDEATLYREQSIYQVDTMRSNFLAWMDSLKRTKIYGNMIIYPDSGAEAEAYFDSITGKPALRFR